MREAADYEAAGAGGKTGWERFLQTHPKGAHAESAKAKLQQIETEALLAQVRDHERTERRVDLEGLVKAHARSSPVGVAAREALARVEETVKARARAERERVAAAREAAAADQKTKELPAPVIGAPAAPGAD